MVFWILSYFIFCETFAHTIKIPVLSNVYSYGGINYFYTHEPSRPTHYSTFLFTMDNEIGKMVSDAVTLFTSNPESTIERSRVEWNPHQHENQQRSCLSAKITTTKERMCISSLIWIVDQEYLRNSCDFIQTEIYSFVNASRLLSNKFSCRSPNQKRKFSLWTHTFKNSIIARDMTFEETSTRLRTEWAMGTLHKDGTWDPPFNGSFYCTVTLGGLNTSFPYMHLPQIFFDIS